MICYVLVMGKQHLGPHVVVGYGIKIFWPGLFITSPDHLEEVSNARFLAGNTNKALYSAATFAILDVLDAITSRCRRPKKSAMEEATEI